MESSQVTRREQNLKKKGMGAVKRIVLTVMAAAIVASCGGGGNSSKGEGVAARGAEVKVTARGAEDEVTYRPEEKDRAQERVSSSERAGAIIIAKDIVTEVIIRPDPEGDPWESEKVEGYDGEPLTDNIFRRIYDGSLTVYDYHSGERLSPDEVRSIEKEFNNDRSKIGKLSFTEEWYYYPEFNRIEKVTLNVTFGYELRNNHGKVYAYKAAFRADLN